MKALTIIAICMLAVGLFLVGWGLRGVQLSTGMGTTSHTRRTKWCLMAGMLLLLAGAMLLLLGWQAVVRIHPSFVRFPGLPKF